jgi:hypothetical protein
MVPYTALASPRTENHSVSPNCTARAPTSATSVPGHAARRPPGASGRTRNSSTSSPKKIASGSSRVTANCAAPTIQDDRRSCPRASPTGEPQRHDHERGHHQRESDVDRLAFTNGRVSLLPQASLTACRRPPIAPLEEYSRVSTPIQPRAPAPAAISSSSCSTSLRAAPSSSGRTDTIAATIDARTLSSPSRAEKAHTDHGPVHDTAAGSCARRADRDECTRPRRRRDDPHRLRRPTSAGGPGCHLETDGIALHFAPAEHPIADSRRACERRPVPRHRSRGRAGHARRGRGAQPS